MQVPIPCVLMRGGTSRGPFFLREDLPPDDAETDRLLISAMGSPHVLQLDGIGGGNSLTSKVAIVSRSQVPGVDVDYLFVQVNVHAASVDRKPNCGNMLSAVGPFAVESGLVQAGDGETRLVVRNVNTDSTVELVVQTPGRRVTYEGATSIDGVPGTAAPIQMRFSDAVGSVTGSLLPAGAPMTTIEGIEVSLVDAAIPVMLLRAADVGLSGGETPAEIDAATTILERIEQMRIEAGRLMGLGDVRDQVVPKVALLSKPQHGGTLSVRYLTPLRCHASLAVTGAVTIATATSMPGTVAHDMVGTPGTVIELEHPAGHLGLTVEPQFDATTGQLQFCRTALIRTARRIFEGTLLVTM